MPDVIQVARKAKMQAEVRNVAFAGAKAQLILLALSARFVWVETQIYQSCPFTKPCQMGFFRSL